MLCDTKSIKVRDMSIFLVFFNNFMRDTYENEKYASNMNLELELFEKKEFI